MAHLEHLFLKGIRFDTEVEYPAQDANGLRYVNLPQRKSASARACALASVLQCLAVLGRLSRQQVTQVRRLAGKALQRVDDDIDIDSILRCIEATGLPIAAESHAPGPDLVVDSLGMAALEALRAGRACLVHFESIFASRWAMVIGVEWERASGQVRALLLLDSGAGEPWACAHNVRIELQAQAGRSLRASAGFTLNCRHLTGEACAVRLCSLIVLRDTPGRG